MTIENKGQKLEELLTLVFNKLREAEELTEEKVDIQFCLDVVGSYIIAKETNQLAAEYSTPAQLFEDKIFKILADSAIDVEVIKEEE